MAWKKVKIWFYTAPYPVQSFAPPPPPGRPVYSGTNSTSLGSILDTQQLIAKTINKGSFYIAQYPVRWTTQSASHFSSPDSPLHSVTNSASLGSILAMQQLRATTKSLTFPPLSIARYSFIQQSEQGRQWRERKCTNFETVEKGGFYH